MNFQNNEIKKIVMTSHIFGDSNEPKFNRNSQPENPYSNPRNNEIPQYRSQNSDSNLVEMKKPTQYIENTKGYNSNGSRIKFLSTPVKTPTIQHFGDLIKESQIPNLSPFPEFRFENFPINENYNFNIKPITSQNNRNFKKLTNYSNSDIKKVQDEIKNDSESFNLRIRKNFVSFSNFQ